MEFYQLKTFYSVATHLNFTKAALELSISQPAVSRQIEALESHYELSLFYRTKKKVELTDAGRHLLTYAIQIISIADQAEKALSSLTELESGQLYVGCGTTIGTFVITDLVMNFQKKYPDIKINLLIENTSTIIEKLIDSKIDLAIIAKDLNDPRFNYQPLFQDKIYAYSSIEHKAKFEHTYSLQKLEDELFFLREKGSNTRECVDNQLNDMELSSLNFVELSTNEAIKQAILNGHGIGFLSSTAVSLELKCDLIFKIPHEEIIERNFSIISPKGKYASPITLIFSSFLSKNTRKYY